MTVTRSAVPDTGVGVLDRAVAVLDAIEGGVHTFTGLVEATGFSRTTTHRLVKSLVEHELLSFRGGYGYRLGPRLLRYAQRATQELPLRHVAHPFLERLAEMTGESAQLYLRSRLERVCVDAVESASELRTIVEVGSSLPLSAGSAGKVFLAFDDLGASGDRLIDEALQWTPATPIGEELRRQVAQTRRRGWAHSAGERQRGVASVSAPVFGAFGELLGVISVSGPASRLGRVAAGRYAKAVLATARDIRASITP